MKSIDVNSFRFQSGKSFLEQAPSSKEQSADLSMEEEKMIKRKFKNTPLSFYEESGDIRKEMPSARGSKLDVKA